MKRNDMGMLRGVNEKEKTSAVTIFLSLISLLVICLVLGFKSDGIAQPGITEKITLDYKTDEKVVEILYGEIEVSAQEARQYGLHVSENRKPSDRIKVQYPKVVITESKIQFLDERSKLKSSVARTPSVPGKSGSIVRSAKNKKYIALNNILKYNQPAERVEDGELIMLNDDGSELWKRPHNFANIIPSPNGRYILGTPDSAFGGAPISVINEKGVIKEIKKDSRRWKIDFSKDGSYFAVTIQTRIEGDEKYRADLIVLSESGEELWRINSIARGTASDSCPVTITDDDLIIVTTGVPEFQEYRFDKQGNRVAL